MAGFDDKILKAALRMVPQSLIDGVPELIVNAVNARIKAAKSKCNDNESPAVMIFPGENDCIIQIVGIDYKDNIRTLDFYPGKAFVQNLLEEVNHG